MSYQKIVFSLIVFGGLFFISSPLVHAQYGGGGPSVGFGGFFGISGQSAQPQGQVLGTSTSSGAPAVLGAECGPQLTSYLREGRNNSADQVELLQTFLNQQLGLSIPVTGYFGPMTFKAVEEFQTQQSASVLAPWVPLGLQSASTPTGYVYKTTKWEINHISCPTNGVSAPILP